MDKEHRRKTDRGVTALISDTLTDLMGIDNEVVSQVMGVLKRTGQYASAKNYIRKLPPDVHRYWIQTLDRAEKETGVEDETKSKDKDEHVDTKHSDNKSVDKKDAKPDKEANEKPDTKESFKGTFATYLIELNSRQVATALTLPKEERIKAGRMNDTALTRQRAQELDAEKRSENPMDKKIAMARQRLALLLKQKEQESGGNASTTPANENEEWEEVWVDADTDKVLSESAIRAYKRSEGKMIKKYRCLAGSKKGRLASSPGDCTKRKDPKKVRQGRMSVRKHQGSRITKTRIAKRQSASRLVTRMNQRLSGKLPAQRSKT